VTQGSRALIKIATSQPYTVHVGPGAAGGLAGWLASEHAGARLIILSDENVDRLHGQALGALGDAPRLVLAAGEASKSFQVLERVLDFMCAANLDRDSILVAFGGGVIGDLGGLAASLYMRGIGVVHCPTTLLSQVDSSIGGKTAINLMAGKNLAGSFHQPEAVFSDSSLLATLSDLELRSGLGEVIKSALIGDAELFSLLEAEAPGILAKDPSLLTEIVRRCAQVKGSIVARDEQESGERQKLNLGHTFAHAIEHNAGFGKIPHGEAVATGLQLACELSALRGDLQDAELPARLRGLLQQLGLSASLKDLARRFEQSLDPEALMLAMQHDKKSSAGQPLFVLPTGMQQVVAHQAVERDLLSRLLNDQASAPQG
jgi:3-dehydroquinate synthase